ncbi:MAG: Mrp/NBP35 family ATP-binding protein [Pseudomonadota bacterium]
MPEDMAPKTPSGKPANEPDPQSMRAPAPTLMQVRAALRAISVTHAKRSIIAEGRVESLTLDEAGTVRLILHVGAAPSPSLDAGNIDDPAGERVGGALNKKQIASVVAATRDALLAVDGVSDAIVVATDHSDQTKRPDEPGSPPGRQPGIGGHDNPLGLARGAPSTPTRSAPTGNTAPIMPGAAARKRARAEKTEAALSTVKTVLAVASGKGGVGKSTITLGLAYALAQAGQRVGILDADVYGPSLPALTGITTKAQTELGKIIPVKLPSPGGGPDIAAMSMGWLVDEAQALAWRGPMVMGAIRQLINDVTWPALDILLIDTPPGTGDAHLTLIQSNVLHGAIIVSTPQMLAIADVRRGLSLFAKTKVPILGMVENMAWMETSDGARTYPFGPPQSAKITSDLNIPLLASLPLDPHIQTLHDTDKSKPFRDLATRVLAGI